jgi:hypothetical protein
MTRRPIPAAIESCVFRIEELVLHGFHGADRHAIAGAMERELGRLLGEAGSQQALLARERTIGDHRLDAGSFAVPADATPGAIGIEVARAIHRSLGNSGRSREPSNPGSVRAPPAPGARR